MVHPMLILVTSMFLLNSASPQGPSAKADIAKSVPQEVGDISGYYSCKGVEAGGKAYSGVAIVAKKNDVYLVQWMVGGASTFSGVGIRQADTLSPSWALPPPRRIIRGLTSYPID